MSDLIKKIPLPQSAEYLFYPSGDGCELALFNDVTYEDFEAYADNLIENAFKLINENKIENNYFKFFKNDRLTVSFGFYECDKTMRVVVDSNINLPQFKPCNNIVKREKTTLWQFEVDHSLIDCGMCYIFRTVTGAFFIIDSAHTYSVNDCERIHKFLRERTPENEKIRIAGWFFSHGHEDHIAQFINYFNFFCEDTVIDNLYFNFISLDHRDGDEWMDGFIARLL